MDKPNVSKALADAIYQVTQQVHCNSSAQHLQTDSRVLASIIIHSLNCHSINDISTWIRWRLSTSIRPDKRKINPIDDQEMSAQMKDIQNIRKLGRRKKLNKSKLEPLRAQITHFKSKGHSLAEIRDWLRRYARIKVHKSTISRKLYEWSNYDKA